MSSFLEKLKSGGGSTVNNHAPPDAHGAVVRRIEKVYATQPVEELGLSMTDDAEIIEVRANSLAHAANISPGYIIMDVNGEFVENARQFYSYATRSLNLTLRMQSSSAIAELIARVLRSEENESSDGAHAQIDFQELLRTTPRYNFLSNEHPLFRRYVHRLQTRREATALIRQRMQEAEDKQRREILRNIAREREAAEEEAARAAEQRKHEEDAMLSLAKPTEGTRDDGSAHDDHTAASHLLQEGLFMRIIDDQSAFQSGDSHADLAPPGSELTLAGRSPRANNDGLQSASDDSMSSSSVSSTSDSDSTSRTGSSRSSGEDSLAAPPAMAVALSGMGIAPAESRAVPTAISQSQLTSELLALIGAPTELCLAEPTASPVRTTSTGAYTKLPSEVYTTASGEEVVLTLKKRTGPLPTPPVGKPPRINREAQRIMSGQGAPLPGVAGLQNGQTIHASAATRGKAPLRMSPVRPEERSHVAAADTRHGEADRHANARSQREGAEEGERRRRLTPLSYSGSRRGREGRSSRRRSRSHDRHHRSRHEYNSKRRRSSSREDRRHRSRDDGRHGYSSSSRRRRDRSDSADRYRRRRHDRK